MRKIKLAFGDDRTVHAAEGGKLDNLLKECGVPEDGYSRVNLEDLLKKLGIKWADIKERKP